MKKLHLLLPLGAILIILGCCLSSCNSKHKGFKKDKTGFYYKFHTINEGDMPQIGDVVEMTYTMHIGDSILIPTGIYSDRIIEPVYQGDIYNALQTMHVGDSATFIFEADTFFRYFQMPFEFEEKDLYVDVKLNSLMRNDEVEQMIKTHRTQDSLWREQRRIMEDSLITAYLSIQKIKTQPSLTGMYLMFNKKGIGPKAQIGDTVVFSYKMKSLEGHLLAEKPSTNPDTLIITTDLLPCMEETLCSANKGAHIKTIIPSKLAFGEYGTPQIPPYTPIDMEIEIHDILFSK